MTRQGGFHGPPFHASRGTAQGGLTSPTPFNVAVESVIGHWLSLTINNHAANHDDIGEAVGHNLGVFYVNDGMIVSRNPGWLHKDINVLIGLFRRIGLEANISKSKTMIFQMEKSGTGCQRMHLPEEAQERAKITVTT